MRPFHFPCTIPFVDSFLKNKLRYDVSIQFYQIILITMISVCSFLREHVAAIGYLFEPHVTSVTFLREILTPSR